MSSTLNIVDGVQNYSPLQNLLSFRQFSGWSVSTTVCALSTSESEGLRNSLVPFWRFFRSSFQHHSRNTVQSGTTVWPVAAGGPASRKEPRQASRLAPRPPPAASQARSHIGDKLRYLYCPVLTALPHWQRYYNSLFRSHSLTVGLLLGLSYRVLFCALFSPWSAATLEGQSAVCWGSAITVNPPTVALLVEVELRSRNW